MEISEHPERPLLARLYGEKPGDWQEVASWWRERGEPFAETLLPPLGIVVEHDGVMLAAIWCYESYGIGVAFLEFPCSKPGIPPALAWRAVAWAEQAVANILRAKGEHKIIRAFAQARHASAMERIGYVRGGENLVSVIKRID